MTSRSDSRSVQRASTLLRRINRWLERVGVANPTTRANVSIDLADTLDAASLIRSHLRAILACSPTSRLGATRALQHWGTIDAQTSELRSHLGSLRRTWESRVGLAIAKRSGDKRRLRHAAA
jgi:hypothetical protein